MDVAIKFLIQKKITVILGEANPISKFKTPVSKGRSLCLDTKEEKALNFSDTK